MTENVSSGFPEIEANVSRLRRLLSGYPSAQLMAVTKSRTCEEIRFAIDNCNITLAGENRVQEFIGRKSVYDGISVHFIGTLQKNKVKYLVGNVAAIESVGKKEVAAEIDRISAARGVITDIFAEVNTGREMQKSGLMPEELPEFLSLTNTLPNIRTVGLMTVSPVSDDSAVRRGYFSLLRRLRDENKSLFGSDKPLLSMGMTDSIEDALAEGADIVRIGVGIFGKRRQL